MLTMMFSMLLASLGAATASAAARRPHLVFMLADDLGWYDTAVTGDQSSASRRATHNLTQLADQGMRLSHHYVHWHCSPSRRSFLTGRLPLHHGERLSGVDTDEIDLRWTWISEKLHSVGYVSHWYGKGHTGFQSMHHMPPSRGFNGGSVIYLGGAGSYYNLERWNGSHPLYTFDTNPHEYSTDLFGSLAVKAVEQHDPSTPLFLYLAWQAVHAPYDLPPRCREEGRGGTDECPNKIRAMINDVDIWAGRLVTALKAKGMYEDTLIVFTSDNGGVWAKKDGLTGGGINYPLRGEKHTNWQGGMRATTFVSGGFLPTRLRGTTHGGTFHIVDWYPTFCALAGADGSDDAPVAPLPVDPSDPAKDIYGDRSWPGLDGHDIWGELTAGERPRRRYLWLSGQVIIKDGRYKLVTAQPMKGVTNNPPVTGWRLPDGSWKDGGKIDGPGCGAAFLHRENLRPCLFDLERDQREEHDLSGSQPALVEELWRELNRTELTAYLSRSPSELKGHCDAQCAKDHWTQMYGHKSSGPICGVPGCTGESPASIVV